MTRELRSHRYASHECRARAHSLVGALELNRKNGISGPVFMDMMFSPFLEPAMRSANLWRRSNGCGLNRLATKRSPPRHPPALLRIPGQPRCPPPDRRLWRVARVSQGDDRAGVKRAKSRKLKRSTRGCTKLTDAWCRPERVWSAYFFGATQCDLR